MNIKVRCKHTTTQKDKTRGEKLRQKAVHPSGFKCNNLFLFKKTIIPNLN